MTKKTEEAETRSVGKKDSLGHNMLIGSLQLTAIRKVEAIWRRITRKGMVRKMVMVSPCSKKNCTVRTTLSSPSAQR